MAIVVQHGMSENILPFLELIQRSASERRRLEFKANLIEQERKIEQNRRLGRGITRGIEGLAQLPQAVLAKRQLEDQSVNRRIEDLQDELADILDENTKARSEIDELFAKRPQLDITHFGGIGDRADARVRKLDEEIAELKTDPKFQRFRKNELQLIELEKLVEKARLGRPRVIKREKPKMTAQEQFDASVVQGPDGNTYIAKAASDGRTNWEPLNKAKTKSVVGASLPTAGEIAAQILEEDPTLPPEEVATQTAERLAGQRKIQIAAQEAERTVVEMQKNAEEQARIRQAKEAMLGRALQEEAFRAQISNIAANSVTDQQLQEALATRAKLARVSNLRRQGRTSKTLPGGEVEQIVDIPESIGPGGLTASEQKRLDQAMAVINARTPAETPEEIESQLEVSGLPTMNLEKATKIHQRVQARKAEDPNFTIDQITDPREFFEAKMALQLFKQINDQKNQKQ